MDSEALLSYFQRMIQRLVAETGSTNGQVRDDCYAFDIFVDSLERVLSHERKAEFVPTTYWEIFSRLGESIAWIGEAVAWIQRDVPDFEARGRSLLRYFLNHKMLSSALATLLASDILEEYYEDASIFLKDDEKMLFLQQVKSLDSLEFLLQINSNDRFLQNQATSETAALRFAQLQSKISSIAPAAPGPSSSAEITSSSTGSTKSSSKKEAIRTGAKKTQTRIVNIED